MKTLTPETERRLLAAVDAVGEHVSDGATPSAAIVKAARAHGLGPGHLPRLVEAYNVGRTMRQLREGSTPREKGASFPLADLDEVRGELYGGPAKAAAEPAPWDGYRRAPERPQPRPAPRVKAAAEGAPPAAPEIDPVEACLAAERSQYPKRAVEHARRLADAEYRAMAQAATKLASLLEARGAPALGSVRENVRLTRPGGTLAVLDDLVASRPALAKRAGAEDEHPWREGDPVYAEVDRLADHARHHALYKAATEQLEGEALLIGHLARTGRMPAVKQAGPLSDVTRGMSMGLGRGAGDTMMGNLAGSLRDSHDSWESRALRDLGSSEQDHRLRQIRATAVLADAMRNDPVLAGHGRPEEVIDAFNQISQFTPRLVDQPLVMRAVLRRAVQSPLELYDVQSLAQIAKSQQSLSPGWSRPQAAEGGPKPPVSIMAGRSLDRLISSTQETARSAGGAVRSFAPGGGGDDEDRDRGHGGRRP